MPFLDVSDGTELFFEDTGGDALPVLLAHGFLMDHRSFDPQVDEFPEYRWVRWDLRGHGRTTTPEDGFTFWDQARDGLALLDHLGIERAVFGGHSQGGFLAMRMALLAPDRCAGLLLFGTTDEPYPEEHAEGYRLVFADWDPRSEAGENFARTLATTMIGGELEYQQMWRERWKENSLSGFSAAVDCLVEVDDLSGLTPTLERPALVVRGVADQAFTPEQTQRLVDRLGPNSSLVTIPDQTHGAHMTAPQAVNRHVRGWLTEVSA